VRPQRRPGPEPELIHVDGVGDDRRANAEPCKHVLEEAGRHHVALDPSQRAPGNRRSPEMVGGFAAVVIQHDRLAKELGDQDGGQRGKQERQVRGGKYVHDISTPQLPEEQRPIEHLRGRRAHVFDRDRAAQNASRHRVDGDEPGEDDGITPPRAQQAIGLDGLAAEDTH
jgi:hypothetical protein